MKKPAAAPTNKLKNGSVAAKNILCPKVIGVGRAIPVKRTNNPMKMPKMPYMMP